MITNTEARFYPGPGNLQRGSRPGSRLAYRLIAQVLALVAVMLSASAAQSAQEQSASINSEVEAGENYTTRLRNLPKDAEVSVHIETSGEVAVLLINHRDYTAFPETKGPLFSGQITDSLDFSIRIPASGNYYLVLDNRKGGKKLEFKLHITAKAKVRASDVTTTAETSEKLKQANQDLEKFEANLRQFFTSRNQGLLSALTRVHKPVSPKSTAFATSMKPARAASLASAGMASSRLPRKTSTCLTMSGTRARSFSMCGGKKWIIRSGRTGNSRTGWGAPMASGL